MKTLSWTHAVPERTSAGVWRHAAAATLRSASAALSRLARRVRGAPPALAPRLPVIEFHPFHHEAGAPEGALYVDGELVGFVPGISRL